MLILASKSPRRKEFLEKANLEFIIDTILGADTIVVCENQILGKPRNIEHAKDMLRLLSNKAHYVMTGVIIKSIDKEISFVEKTKVYFKQLTESDIEILTTKENVLDKAGSYAIQGVAGTYIEKIEGDYDNVVGLPIKRVLKYIK